MWYPDITESEEMDIARGKAVMTPTMSLERLKAAILKNTARVRMQEVEHMLNNGEPEAQKMFAEDMEGETIIEDFVDGLCFDMSDLKALLDLSSIANEMQLHRLSTFCLETLLILSRENTRPMLKNKVTLLDDQTTGQERRRIRYSPVVQTALERFNGILAFQLRQLSRLEKYEKLRDPAVGFYIAKDQDNSNTISTTRHNLSEFTWEALGRKLWELTCSSSPDGLVVIELPEDAPKSPMVIDIESAEADPGDGTRENNTLNYMTERQAEGSGTNKRKSREDDQNVTRASKRVREMAQRDPNLRPTDTNYISLINNIFNSHQITKGTNISCTQPYRPTRIVILRQMEIF